MDIHKNARLSFRSRELLVQRVVERAVRVYWIAPRGLIAVRVGFRKR
jgi:leucine-zipper of insertion element IS481